MSRQLTSSMEFNQSLPASGYSHWRDVGLGWLAVATAFFLPLSTSVTDVLFIACPLLVVLTRRWSALLQLIWQRRALLLLLVLFGWMLIGISYSVVPFKEALAGLSKYDKLLLGVLFAPIFIEEKWRNYALHAFFLAIVVTIGMAIVKQLGAPQLGEKFGQFLVFKDRIQTSFLMAMAAYFSASLWFSSDATPAKITRGLYAGLFLISTLFLFSIGGRSGYLVFFILLAWLLWSRWRWRGAVSALLAICVILASAYFLSPAFNARLQESTHDVQVYQTGEDNTSLGLRAKFAENSLRLVKQHPLVGAGTGSFVAQYAQLHIPAHLLTTNPHDQYIHILVQWGGIGLLLLLWTFYAQWQDSKLLTPGLRQIAQGVILAIAFGSLANSWLLDTTEGHFYVYFMALAFASQVQTKALWCKMPADLKDTL